MSQENSTKVVLAALAGNVLVAITKFAAAAISGSSAMLTEAIHSTADSSNQLLLLFGGKRSRRPADAAHAFGHGSEIYFWTFVIAVIVLLAGGAASIYQGYLHIKHPAEMKSPLINYAVIALSVLFEGSSLSVAYREFKRTVRRFPGGNTVSLWRFIELSKDPNLYESLLEDSAALIGLSFAALGVLGSTTFKLQWADGAASIAIGLLLIATSIVIARATQSLIAGESAAPALLRQFEQVLVGNVENVETTRVRTLMLGPKSILIAVTLVPQGSKKESELEKDLAELTEKLKGVDMRVDHVLFQFDEERR